MILRIKDTIESISLHTKDTFGSTKNGLSYGSNTIFTSEELVNNLSTVDKL